MEQRDPTQSRTFCALAWMHSEIDPEGSFRPCCIFSGEVADGEHHASIETRPIKELVALPRMNAMRKAMAAGESVPGCKRCYEDEARAQQSYRTWANGYFLTEDIKAEIAAKVGSGDFGFVRLTAIDVRFGNTCNLKCRMCNPKWSSQIEKDPVHSRWARLYPSTMNTRTAPVPSRFDQKWFDDERFLEELKAASTDLTVIQLAGGEPSVSKPAIAWLNWLAETGKCADISLTIWTNATNINQHFFDILNGFKSVSINLSIDAIEDTYEYMRFPANWHKVEENVINLRAKVPKAWIAVMPVFQLYNMLSITDVFRWADRIGIGKGMLTILETPFLEYRLAPLPIRHLAADRLAAYMTTLADSEPVKTTIAALVAEIRANTEYMLDQKMFAEFQRFTEQLDRSRSQHLAASIPELSHMLAVHASGVLDGDLEDVPDLIGLNAERIPPAAG